jgi:hypothetical protein
MVICDLVVIAGNANAGFELPKINVSPLLSLPTPILWILHMGMDGNASVVIPQMAKVVLL